jgi:hypothetical protein
MSMHRVTVAKMSEGGRPFSPVSKPVIRDRFGAASPSLYAAPELIVFECWESLTPSAMTGGKGSFKLMCPEAIAHKLNGQVEMRGCADENRVVHDVFLHADAAKADAEETGWYRGRFLFTKCCSRVVVLQLLVAEGFDIQTTSTAVSDKVGIIQTTILQRGGPAKNIQY